ncbi:MAG: glycosyltransferase, partial [Acidobacteria bacterium]|nr:glycosyltransferase [Acidobacteriota bacterium]
MELLARGEAAAELDDSRLSAVSLFLDSRLAGLSGLLIAGMKALLPSRRDPLPGPALPQGVSVVIPSRDGQQLLERLLPGLMAGLAGLEWEVIVVDNGSTDGTAELLGRRWPQITRELSDRPLGFAVAVNRGIRRARYSHVCLLNNDMVLEPGFFAALLA